MRDYILVVKATQTPMCTSTEIVVAGGETIIRDWLPGPDGLGYRSRPWEIVPQRKNCVS